MYIYNNCCVITIEDVWNYISNEELLTNIEKIKHYY